MTSASNNIKHFVLLSGGIDSATVLYMLRATPPETEIEGVSINYGQRLSKELSCAAAICEAAGCKHTVISIPQIFGNAMLTNADRDVPKESYDELRDKSETGVAPAYVPFRNGVFLSILAAHAWSWIDEQPGHAAVINIGAHADDVNRGIYADCSKEFLSYMSKAIMAGTYDRIRLIHPVSSLTKAQIVELGARLGVPYEKTWSCYQGGDAHCGECASCRSRKEAFRIAGVSDPTNYLA